MTAPDPKGAGKPGAIKDSPVDAPQTADNDVELVKLEDTVSDGVYEVTDTAEFVTLSRDIVEEFYFPDTKRPSYRLLYTKGQVVPRAAIEAYNADTKAANELRSNGGVDPKNPAGIDATTIASGTRVTADQGTAQK